LRIGVVTKSDLVTRDKELLRTISDHNELFVNLTITTTDTRLARILEPRAPRPDLRLKALRELREAGIAAGVYCAPVVPGITDSPQALEDLVYEVKRAGGLHVVALPLFLRPCSASVFLPFLEQEFPELAARYRERYASREFIPKSYAQRLRDLMKKLRAKYDMSYDFSYRNRQRITEERDTPAQMEMFYELREGKPEPKPRPRRRAC
jgi:DNA repair photolyase